MRIIEIPNHLLISNKKAYNPTIVEAYNNTYMFYRYEPLHGDHNTYIAVCELDQHWMPKPGSNRRVEMLPHRATVTTYDDPRAIAYQGTPMLTYCHGQLMRKDDAWLWCCSIGLAAMPQLGISKQWLPDYGNNINASNKGKTSHIATEKNWSPFIWKDKFMYTYTLNPLLVLEYDLKENRIFPISDTSVKIKHWKWGSFLGGGTPLLYRHLADGKGEYFGFFHSFTEDSHGRNHQRRYHVGYIVINDEKPFKIKRMSKAPVMSAEKDPIKDLRHQSTPWLPNCVYPCGIMERGGKIYMSYGWQDCRCWIAEYDLEELDGKGKTVVLDK
jgi:predicted GH43/DUF377 family glycosyl hydrolase